MSRSALPRSQAVKLALDKHTLRRLVAEANLAPSLYNTQPARWRFLPDGTVILFEDLSRRLSATDPTGRHARMAVGAAYTGLGLALSKIGLGLSLLQLVPHGDTPDEDGAALRKVACALVTQGAGRDVLAGYVRERRTFRGQFEPVDRDMRDALLGLIRHFGDVVAVARRADIDAIARLNQQCQDELMRRKGYLSELYRWMNWSRHEAQMRRDGLYIKDMPLAGLPRIAKPLLLRSIVHSTMERLGMVPELFDEAGSIRSACAIGLLTGPCDEDAFVSGQKLYRVWLELCRAGYALCPMAALNDSAEGIQGIQRIIGIPGDRQITGLFRIGKVAAGTRLKRQRLSARDLLV